MTVGRTFLADLKKSGRTLVPRADGSFSIAKEGTLQLHGETASERPKRLLEMKQPKKTKTEQRAELLLQEIAKTGLITSVTFESIKFRLGPQVAYTPDFHFILSATNTPAFLEVKGAWLTDDCMAKFKMACGLFPWAFFAFVQWDRKASTWIFHKHSSHPQATCFQEAFLDVRIADLPRASPL